MAPAAERSVAPLFIVASIACEKLCVWPLFSLVFFPVLQSSRFVFRVTVSVLCLLHIVVG